MCVQAADRDGRAPAPRHSPGVPGRCRCSPAQIDNDACICAQCPPVVVIVAPGSHHLYCCSEATAAIRRTGTAVATPTLIAASTLGGLRTRSLTWTGVSCWQSTSGHARYRATDRRRRDPASGSLRCARHSDHETGVPVRHGPYRTRLSKGGDLFSSSVWRNHCLPLRIAEAERDVASAICAQRGSWPGWRCCSASQPFSPARGFSSPAPRGSANSGIALGMAIGSVGASWTPASNVAAASIRRPITGASSGRLRAIARSAVCLLATGTVIVAGCDRREHRGARGTATAQVAVKFGIFEVWCGRRRQHPPVRFGGTSPTARSGGGRHFLEECSAPPEWHCAGVSQHRHRSCARDHPIRVAEHCARSTSSPERSASALRGSTWTTARIDRPDDTRDLGLGSCGAPGPTSTCVPERTHARPAE